MARFVVTSHGWSASNWLAYVLNAHPEITCAHSSAAIVASDRGIFDGEGLKSALPALRKGYVQRQNRPFAAVYDEIEAAHPAPFVGTVHTYRLRDLPVQSQRFGSPDTEIPLVNLVRHPLDLVVSGYGQFRDLFRIDLNEFAWTLRKLVDQGLDLVEDICRRHDKQPGDYEVVCFLGACVVLGSLRLDVDALAAIRDAGHASRWDYRGVVKMEEMTEVPAVVAGLIERLTGRSDLADTSYLETVASLGHINRHNQAARRGTAERWADLEAWQQEGFRLFLQRFALQGPYTDMGYSFDFLED